MARVEFTKDSITPSLQRLMPVLNRNLYQVMRFHEPGIRSQAKTNAPWQDDTGNARNGLNAEASVPSKNTYVLTLYGSVKYQTWLEVRFAGKYAIIMPTVRSYAPKVIASMHKLLERMGVSEG